MIPNATIIRLVELILWMRLTVLKSIAKLKIAQKKYEYWYVFPT